MDVRIVAPDEAARIAADLVEAVLRDEPRPVIGLATGSSPLGVYDELARRHVEEGLSLAHARGFLLDEYIGLPLEHPERYRKVIERELVSRVDLDPAAVQGPDGLAADPDAAAAEYDRAIAAAGGVDVQLLGIGTDGHLAFNEPGSSLASRTRVMPLTQQTRRDNARFFGGDVEAVPRLCLTQGLGTILEARQLVLLASGEAKAEAVRQMIEGPVSALCPASVLQLHPRATILLDEAAASRLSLAPYFREMQSSVAR